MSEANGLRAVSIREGSVPEDIELCADIWVRALEARDGSVNAAAMAQRVRETFRTPIVRFGVATAPCPGFAVVGAGREDPTEAMLHYLAADPDGVSGGVGSALLEDAVRHARSASFASLVLEVRTTNHRAIGLYTRFGFAPFGAPVPHPLTGYPMQAYSLRLA